MVIGPVLVWKFFILHPIDIGVVINEESSVLNHTLSH